MGFGERVVPTVCRDKHAEATGREIRVYDGGTRDEDYGLQITVWVEEFGEKDMNGSARIFEV